MTLKHINVRSAKAGAVVALAFMMASPAQAINLIDWIKGVITPVEEEPVYVPLGPGAGGGNPSVPDPNFGVVVFGPVIVPQGGGAGGGNPSVPDPN